MLVRYLNIISKIVGCIICLFVYLIVFANFSYATTYYVSPTGLDSNSGSQSAPWESAYKAARTLIAGDTAIFMDGTYVETDGTNFINSGTSSAPITLRSQNKWGAKLYYQGLANSGEKIRINTPYVILQDFEITEDSIGNDWGDVLVRIWSGGNNVKILGNKIHYGKLCIKPTGMANSLIEGNVCYGNGGIDGFNMNGGIIRNNELYSLNGIGITVKGGSRSTQIYNNYVHSSSSMTGGIYLGGTSCGPGCGVYSLSGYEAYNSVAYNNVIVSNVQGAIGEGLTIAACTGCAFFNNVVIGTKTALVTYADNSITNGWNWQYSVNNPQFKNNIVMDCSLATNFSNVTGTMSLDYNLFQNCPGTPTQSHAVSGDPLFVNKFSDWHLQSNSPAINSGATLAFTGFSAENIDVSKDRDGFQRGNNGAWDIGTYEYGGASSTKTPTPSVQPTNTIIASPTINSFPSPWQQIMIGGATGSAQYTNGTFSITTTSGDIWGTSDSFSFAYQPLATNTQVVAKVTDIGNSANFAKAGVMVRQSLNANSMNVFMGITYNQGVTFQARTTLGGTTGPGVTLPPQPERTPYWVKLVRSGDVFTGYASPDGANWTQIGSATIPLINIAYAGLAVAGNNTTLTNTSTFSNVSMTATKLGDANADNEVDGIDYISWLFHYNQIISGGASVGDFDSNGKVDGSDYIVWLTNYRS
jgi:hypothetical protein